MSTSKNISVVSEGVSLSMHCILFSFYTYSDNEMYRMEKNKRSRLPNGPFSHAKLTMNFDDVSVGITTPLGKMYVRGSGNRFPREFLDRRRDRTEMVNKSCLVGKKKGCHVPCLRSRNSRGKRFPLHAHTHQEVWFRSSYAR